MRQSAEGSCPEKGQGVIGDFPVRLHGATPVAGTKVSTEVPAGRPSTVNRYPSVMRPGRRIPLVLAILTIAAIDVAAMAIAQAPPAPAVPSAPATKPSRRPALLREGAMLSLARGRVEPIDEGGWRFVPDLRDANGLEREFILLPNPVLEDVVRLANRPESAKRPVEVSGEILTYGGRNWLLLSFASPIAEAESPAPPSTPARTASRPDDEERIADELERKLLEQVGNVPASLAPSEAELAAAATGPAPIANGSLLQSRRGHLVRDTATGGTRFVFTHQREAVEPASLVLLPCRILDVAEARLRQTEGNPAMVVTGTVVSFAGRNYLRPTAIRFAAEGKGLDP